MKSNVNGFIFFIERSPQLLNDCKLSFCFFSFCFSNRKERQQDYGLDTSVRRANDGQVKHEKEKKKPSLFR